MWLAYYVHRLSPVATKGELFYWSNALGILDTGAIEDVFIIISYYYNVTTISSFKTHLKTSVQFIIIIIPLSPWAFRDCLLEVLGTIEIQLLLWLFFYIFDLGRTTTVFAPLAESGPTPHWECCEIRFIPIWWWS